MFKEKKINENAIKKDFFKVDKKIILSEKILIKTNCDNFIFIESNDFENVILPKENQIVFLTSKNARSQVNFLLNKNPKETYLFCSRLNKKSFEIIKNKNLKGIGLSERVIQKDPVFYNEVSNFTKVKLKNNHSKMVLFNIENDFYVISGSGNASINSRIENYIIENNKSKYLEIKNFFENA